MGNWKHRVKLKHLITKDESPESVLREMKAIADILRTDPHFAQFAELEEFAHTEDLAVANRLLDALYDYCDSKRIWVE